MRRQQLKCLGNCWDKNHKITYSKFVLNIQSNFFAINNSFTHISFIISHDHLRKRFSFNVFKFRVSEFLNFGCNFDIIKALSIHMSNGICVLPNDKYLLQNYRYIMQIWYSGRKFELFWEKNPEQMLMPLFTYCCLHEALHADGNFYWCAKYSHDRKLCITNVVPVLVSTNGVFASNESDDLCYMCN